jgi:hypothetical protein
MTNNLKLAYGNLQPRKPEFLDLGIVVEHNQACCVYHSGADIRSAVIECNTGVFHPSWRAQQEGWKLVQAKSWFQRWLLNTFFDAGFK